MPPPLTSRDQILRSDVGLSLGGSKICLITKSESDLPRLIPPELQQSKMSVCANVRWGDREWQGISHTRLLPLISDIWFNNTDIVRSGIPWMTCSGSSPGLEEVEGIPISLGQSISICPLTVSQSSHPSGLVVCAPWPAKKNRMEASSFLYVTSSRSQ